MNWGNTQRPFWDCPDEIDVGLIGDALVTVYRFLPTEEAIRLFVDAMRPERSDAVKICVIKAIITLISEVRVRRWS